MLVNIIIIIIIKNRSYGAVYKLMLHITTRGVMQLNRKGVSEHEFYFYC